MNGLHGNKLQHLTNIDTVCLSAPCDSQHRSQNSLPTVIIYTPALTKIIYPPYFTGMQMTAQKKIYIYIIKNKKNTASNKGGLKGKQRSKYQMIFEILFTIYL